MRLVLFTFSILAGMQYSSQYQIFYVNEAQSGTFYYPNKLSPIAGATACILAELPTKNKNHFGVGLNFNQKGFVEKGETLSENGSLKGTYSKQYTFNYAAFQLNYRRDLFSIKETILYLNNGFATEYLINRPNIDKGLNFSYIGGLGSEFELKGKWNLIISSEYRTALNQYNDCFTGHYKPYSLGLLIGFRRK